MQNAVKAWRERHQMTQEQAARRLGVTLRNFQNYEAGNYAPPETVRRLMTAVELGVDLEPYDLGPPKGGAGRPRRGK